MSWVAELNASSQKTARESWKNFGPGSVKATSAKATAMANWSVTIQRRFVRNRSTTGDQSGLMTHGR